MATIFEDFHQIARRPGMYIGSKRVSDLMIFAQGYRMALYGCAGRRLHTRNGLPLGYLSFHLSKKYQQPAAMGWAKILAEVTGSEEEGLELFFRELEEFEALTIQRVQDLALTPEKIRYNREEPTVPRIACNGGPWIPRFSNAKALYKLTLSDGRELLAVEKEERNSARIELDSMIWWKNGIDNELERCFGPLEWEDSKEDFLGEKILKV